VTLGNDNGTDRRTDRQTDRRTDRVRRNMRPPPREEGRIIINSNYNSGEGGTANYNTNNITVFNLIVFVQTVTRL